MALRPGPFKYTRQVFFTVSGLALLAIVLLARPVLLPFLLAILVAYVLFPAVKRVEQLRIPRWVAILLVYFVAIGAMAGFATAVLPRLFEETKNLSAELPGLTRRIRDDWLPKIDARLRKIVPSAPKPAASAAPAESAAPDGSAAPTESATPTESAAPVASAPPPPTFEDKAPIIITPRGDGAYEVRLRENLEFRKESDRSWSLHGPDHKTPKGFSSERALRDGFDTAIVYAQRNSLELIKVGRQVVGGVSRGIFYFFITLMLAGYLMITYEGIEKFIRDMWAEPNRPAFDRFIRRLDRGLSGVVRGQLLICLVNGVLSAIGFWIFDLKYWPILALIASIMSIIPIFGSILSTIPAVAIGLTQSFGTAAGVLLWVVGIHQLEANFLNPKIIGDSAKIHPVLVVFALLFGEHFYQITGALLAVPCLSLAQTLFLHFRESVLGLPASIDGRSLELVARGKLPTYPPEADEPTTNGSEAGVDTQRAQQRKATPTPANSTTLMSENVTVESSPNQGPASAEAADSSDRSPASTPGGDNGRSEADATPHSIATATDKDA